MDSRELRGNHRAPTRLEGMRVTAIDGGRGAVMMHAELTFHGLEDSDSAEASVLRWVARIERFHDRPTRCGVRIARRLPDTFEVRVTIDDPTIGVATRAAHENIYVAIADAFRAVHHVLQGDVMKRAS